MKLTANTFVEKIKKNKDNHQRGFKNTIPFLNAPRLNAYLPGIMQGRIYLISALLGVGKSKLLRGMILKSIIAFKKTNKNIPVDVYYNSLEESEDIIIASMVIERLNTKYHYNDLDIKKILSIGDYTIDENTIRIIEQETENVNRMLNAFNFIDIANVDELYQYLVDEAMKNGQIIEGKYVKNNKEHFKIVLIDHLALLTGREDTKATINAFSREMAIQLKKDFDFTIIQFQQQNLTKRVSSNPYDLEPRYEDLGDHKMSAQDADFFIGIFDPGAYENVVHYLRYEIKKFNGAFRSWVIRKNRIGGVIKRVPFYLDFGSEIWHEIPALENITAMVNFQNKHGLNIIEMQESVSNFYETEREIEPGVYFDEDDDDVSKEPDDVPF